MSQDEHIPIKIPSNAEIDKELKEFEAQKASGTVVLPLSASTEIDQALKAFETQSNIAQQMQPPGEQVSINPGNSKMAILIIKYSGGLIKSQKAAESVLLVIAFIIFGISFYLFFGVQHTNKNINNVIIQSQQ